MRKVQAFSISFYNQYSCKWWHESSATEARLIFNCCFPVTVCYLSAQPSFQLISKFTGNNFCMRNTLRHLSVLLKIRSVVPGFREGLGSPLKFLLNNSHGFPLHFRKAPCGRLEVSGMKPHDLWSLSNRENSSLPDGRILFRFFPALPPHLGQMLICGNWFRTIFTSCSLWV